MSETKSDPSVLPASNDHSEILKQVEFYFSDNNLPYDKFLWKETKKNDGWVPIKTIHSFKRMRRYEPFEEVVAAIRKSESLLEVSEDGLQVRRRVPLKVPAAEENKSRFARTVYAKGFGEETPTSQFDIEKFFAQFGPTNQVRLRRTDEGQFKSSVFVEFTKLEDAQKFVSLTDPKPEYNGTELVVMSKQAYVEMKSEQHNFADQANGRRKVKFNAYNELKKHSQNKNSHKRGNFGGRNKRKQRDDEVQEPKKQKTESEANPESTESKPESTESKPESTEPKSESAESKSESTEPKAESAESKPTNAE